MPSKEHKLIGQGTYGCVYRPPIPCQDKRTLENRVTKVMQKKDAMEEIKEMKEVDKIDPKSVFHLSKPEICEFGRITRSEVSALSKCRNINIANDSTPTQAKEKITKDKLILLQVEDGGKSLSDAYKENEYKAQDINVSLLNNLFDAIFPLFVGLDILEKKQYCHFDIKSDNIVISNGKMRFIDWGLSRKFSKVPSSSFVTCRMYWVLPAEQSLLCNTIYPKFLKATKDQDNWNYILKKIAKELEKKYFNSYSVVFDTNNMMRYESAYEGIWEEDAIERYIKVVNDNNMSYFKKNMVSKFDTFSVGLVLIQLLSRLKGRKFSRDISIFHKGTGKAYNMFKDLHGLVVEMTEPFFMDRISAGNALIRLTNLMKKYRNDFSNREINEIIGKETREFENSCPIGKMLNPKTGRCININGAAAKKLRLTRKNKKVHPDKQPQNKLEIAEQEKRIKVCPKDKILNPKTERCVNKNGIIGRKLVSKNKIINKDTVTRKVMRRNEMKNIVVTRKIKQSPNKINSQGKLFPQKNKPLKICPDNKILNPKTNRCVSKNGIIAKELGVTTKANARNRCPNGTRKNKKTGQCEKR